MRVLKRGILQIVVFVLELRCFYAVLMASRSPEQGNIPHEDSFALREKRNGTKLSGALKGAALLKLTSLSTDAFQGSSWGIFPCSG